MICPVCKKLTSPAQYCLFCHAALPQRLFDPNTFTLQDVWLRCDKALTLSSKSAKTIEGYRTAARKLEPYFSTPIAMLVKDDYQDLIDVYAVQSYSAQHELRQVIHMVCAEAISLGLIYQDYARGLVLTGYASKQPPIFTFFDFTMSKYVHPDFSLIKNELQKLERCLPGTIPDTDTIAL